jgi:hypothetical protein
MIAVSSKRIQPPLPTLAVSSKRRMVIPAMPSSAHFGIGI